MMENREIVIYGIIAAVVVISVVSALYLGGFIANSPSVMVTLLQIHTNIIYPYQTSHYIINVTNTGHSAIDSMLVGFYLDGEPQNTSTVSIPAGKSALIHRNYTYASPGMYYFEAVADPGHLLGISNRNSSQSSITVNVTAPEIPDVYVSVPNANIAYTQSFHMSGSGALGEAAIADRYNISSINRMFGQAGAPKSISAKIFENVYPYTANVYGTYVRYANNSSAYTAWLDGTVNPAIVGTVISSFGKKITPLNISTGTIGFTALNGTTSMCTFYSEGWTKLVTYDNASGSGTCVGLSTNSYDPIEGNIIANAVTKNVMLFHYQSRLLYNSSIVLGSALAYSNKEITATNIFGLQYGIFTASIKKRQESLNTSSINATCNGLVYNVSNISVCSYVIPTNTGNYSLPYGLVNSSYLTSNYIINVYSLVNNTQEIAAHDSAAHMFSLLDINESSVQWQEQYKNSCSIINSSIGCKLVSFNYSNNTAYLNITNRSSHQIKITGMNCELLPGFKGIAVNKTIQSNSSVDVEQYCNVVTVPTASGPQTSYTLAINYTYGNTTATATGFVNVTNQHI